VNSRVENLSEVAQEKKTKENKMVKRTPGEKLL